MATYFISSGFHEQDSAHTDHLHQGIDFAIPMNTPVHTFHSGIVTNVTHDTNGFGNAVWVRFNDGYTAVYGHLNTVYVKIGDRLTENQTIALSGSTGKSTGPHLHLGILSPNGQWIDPNQYLHRGDSMLLYISGQQTNINGGSSGIPNMDHFSQQWKGNAEDWFNYLFGIPKSAFDTSESHDLTAQIAEAIQRQIGAVVHDLGMWLLRLSPDILLVVCMGSILGMMIGSERCKHWASVSALGALVLQVVNHIV